MNEGQVVLLATYLLTSAVLVGSGILLYPRKVGRNNWLGLRTNLTIRDDDTWYAVNQSSCWPLAARHWYRYGIVFCIWHSGRDE